MNKAAASLVFLIFAVTLLASLAPTLIALSGAVVPLVVVVAIAAIALRLTFFHTRRW